MSKNFKYIYYFIIFLNKQYLKKTPITLLNIPSTLDKLIMKKIIKNWSNLLVDLVKILI